jgi:hypothetical protein
METVPDLAVQREKAAGKKAGRIKKTTVFRR